MFWSIIDQELVLPRFLYYTLCKYDFAGLNVGSAVPSLTVPVIESIEVVIPSIEKQKRILSLLVPLDDKIALNQRINDNLEQQIQVIFNHYFTNEPYDCLLGDVVKTTSGGTPSRKIEDIYYNGSIPWVKSKELNGTFLFDTEEHITELGVNNSSAKLLPKNSVLIAMYGATVGEYAIISKTMCCNQAVCALIPNDKIPYSYLLMIAKNRKYELINMAVGSAQQNISQVLVKNLPISSNYEIIANFNNATMSIFKEIKNNSSEIVKLMSIRDLLLPKLMSGELKINEMNN
jgi:type I restriction enzyme S subunit